MTTLTNLEVINILSTLKKYENIKLPQKISFTIVKINTLLLQEYQVYSESVKKILNSYSKYFITDENNEPVLNSMGMPTLSEKQELFNNEVEDLLNLKIEVNLPILSESVFNYEDSDKYDSLSPKEMIELSAILCGQL